MYCITEKEVQSLSKFTLTLVPFLREVPKIMSGSYEDPIEMSSLSPVIDDEPMLKITAEFKRLGDRCYLENSGATLYPSCLITKVNDDLTQNVYMNPHSDRYTKECVEQIRSMVLRHFTTDSSNYTVIFTSGTTQSLKLVVESFKFASDDGDRRNHGSFVYLRDNHTSVLGLREIARDKNADTISLPHEEFLKALNSFKKKAPSWKDKFNKKKEGNTLFVYPAQSNFNGHKYPIDCIDVIKDGCLTSHLKKNLCKINNNWYVLLDAAAFVSTSRLDLSKTQPDFVALSFYKIFGYPTGLGALLIKNSSQNVLGQKSYFGGGTVDIVLSSEHFHMKRKHFQESFEDGTLSFLSIIALKHCFDTMHKLIPRTIHDNMMDTISYHTFYLAKDLYNRLLELRHSNGNKAAVHYMDTNFTDIKRQAGVVTFNLLREDGTFIGYAVFQHMADIFNISVRTGCFCNSGACQRHLVSTDKEMKDMYKAGHVCGDEFDLLNDRPTGAIRVSFGFFNTFQDTDKLISMICQCFVKGGRNKIPERQPRYKRNLNNPSNVIQSFKTHNLYNSLSNVQIPNKYMNNNYVNMNDVSHDNDFHSEMILQEAALYPIKSCGAFKIRSSWKIGPRGFEYDREWMIVRDNGVCLTQKQNPKMCMLYPKIDLKQKTMTLNFKGKSSISIYLDQNESATFKESSTCQSKVCADAIQGYDCGDEVADWISEALEVPSLRLIRQSVNDQRTQRKTNDADPKLLSLSNQAQFLLINMATVRWLRNKITDSLFADNMEDLVARFRANIIVDMEKELAEQEWSKVIIGNQEFRVEGHCSRCSMVCINQQTGEKTAEPLRTIAEQFEGKIRFGIYLSHIGNVNGIRDFTINIHAPVKPIINDDNISR